VIGEYLRLALATALVLLPGRLVARAFGQRSTSAMLAWGFAALFLAWTVVFAVHGTVTLALVVLVLIGLGAFAAGRRRSTRPRPVLAWPERLRPVWGYGTVFALGVVLGLLLWRVAGVVSGDGLFHLARIRKLVDLGDLHLRTVDELSGGGLHPGYAFPLWHGFLALVTKLSGLDPSAVVNHEASLLVPLACAVAFEAGAAVFGSAAAGLATLSASLALYCFAAGHGGSYVSLALPATASRQLLVPAAFALFFTFAASGRAADAAAIAAVFGALALVHPTYALFTLVPLGAYAIVRLPEWRRSAVGLVAAFLPAALAFLWLRPLVNETLSHDPSEAEKQRALGHYSSELVVSSLHHYRLGAEVVGRTGAVAVAALVLVPVAGLAARRRWGALVLGGTVAMLALMLVPALFMHFSDAVSLSQSRRAAGFVPFAFAFAGGLALLARSVLLLPLALVAGIVLEHQWPGDFAYGLRRGGPAAVTWVALVGGSAALVLGLLLARKGPSERYGLGAVAAVLFVLPVAVHGFARWSPLKTSDPNALTPALARELRAVPPRSVVIASPETSYEILAAAPVYAVAAPIAHVANTKANDPQSRIDDVEHWLATGDPAIPQKYGATWAVKDGRLNRLSP
jgi:hypothetical protein